MTTNNFSYGNPAVALDLRMDGHSYGPDSNININFNRFIANSPYAINLVSNYVGTLNAEDNWWGCNYGPGATGLGYVPDSIPAFFTSTLGIVIPAQAGTAAGRVLSAFTAGPLKFLRFCSIDKIEHLC